MKKQNCWEFKKCGRYPGGEHEKELGVCPVTVEPRVNGTHGGVNGGRACWLLAGTLCGGQVQGTFAQKLGNCMIDCEFYKKVEEEEGENFEFSGNIMCKLSPSCSLNKLKKK
jgi:hypothetical protein